VDNCPIWIQIGFVLFWDSSQVYDYSSTVVIVFVCEWMCILLVQFFTREGLTGGGAKRERERERERAMSYFVPPCNYCMVEHDLS